IWFVVTRLRHSRRRSLPAMSTASWNTGGHLLTSVSLDRAAGQTDDGRRQRRGAIELMGGDHDRRSRRGRGAHEIVDDVTRGGVPGQAHVTAYGDTAGAVAEIESEGHRLAVDHRNQTGAGAQQGRLARAVGPVDEGDRSALHVEVDASKCGKSAEQRDRGTKV